MTHGYGGWEPSAPYDGSDGWSDAGPADPDQGSTYPASGYPQPGPARHRRDFGSETTAAEPIGYYPDAQGHYDPRQGDAYGAGYGDRRSDPYNSGTGAAYPQATPHPREPWASGGYAADAAPPPVRPGSRQSNPGQVYPGGPAQPGPAYPQRGYPQPGYPEAGYPQPGFTQPGYPQPGYSPQGYREQAYPDHGYSESGYPGARDFPPPTNFRPGPADDDRVRRDGPRDSRAAAPAGTPTRKPGTGKTSGRAPKRQKRRSSVLILWIVVIAIVVGGGYAGYRYYTEHNSPTAASVVTTNTLPSLPAGDPIATQTTDSAPLTAAEVFGQSTIDSRASGGTYSVVKSTAVDGCGGVATGDIATALGKLGCTQAVRADIMSPDHNYVITAGVINLPDTAAATNARTTIKNDIAAKTGTLTGYDAGGTTIVITHAPTSAGWDSRGHYLVYVVIAHTDSQPIATDDDRVPLIVSDITENYLINTVIKARETAH